MQSSGGAHELQRGKLVQADGRAKRSDEPCGRRAFNGYNRHSVDRFDFDMPGPVVIGVDALVAGEIGGFVVIDSPGQHGRVSVEPLKHSRR